MPGVVVANQPGVLLYDADGNPIATTDDGGDFKIEAISKQRNAVGTVINPSTEDTLSTRASQSTLAAADTKLGSIKDTDGIKKITDALPTGDNWIGKTKVGDGTNVADVLDSGGVKRLRVEASQPAGELHNVVLYDSAGHPVGVVLDGAVYRIQADAKVAKGASDLVHLEVLDTVSGMGRLKATIYTPDDDAVSFTAVPPNPASIQNDFVREPGDSANLLVDGDPTPVVFTYDADVTYDISIQEVKFVLVSNSITFGSDYFGATVGPLANGLLVEIISDGNTGTLGNIQQNEDFVNFASPGGFDWVVSSKDMIYATYLIGGGLKLKAGTADKVRVTVRDDIDAAGVYLQCFVKGNLLGV